MKVEFVRGMKHMPNLAKHTFTSAIKSHNAQRPHGANNVIPAFQMEKTKSSRVTGLSTVYGCKRKLGSELASN